MPTNEITGPTVRLLALTLIVAAAPGCKKADAGFYTIPPTEAEPAIVGCIKFMTCTTPGDSFFICSSQYEVIYLDSSASEQVAVNGYYECLAAATSCDEVAACMDSECDPTTHVPSCDGDLRETCFQGRLVQTPCGEAGTAGPRCLTTSEGDAICGERECTAEEAELGAWCDGSTLWQCDGGVVVSQDCAFEPGRPLCATTDGWARCAEALGGPCDPETYDEHCAGDEIVYCDYYHGAVVTYDCGVWALSSSCYEVDGVAGCGVEGDTVCDPRADTRCDVNTVRYCTGTSFIELDCTTLGLVCVERAEGDAICY